MQPHSLQIAVLRALQNGISQRKVCTIFRISRSTVNRWRRNSRSGVVRTFVKKRGRKRILTKEDVKKLEIFFKKHPTATNVDGAVYMKHKVGSSSISNYLTRLSYTRKRVQDVVVNYPTKSDITEIRKFLNIIEKIPNQNRIYVDESFVYLNEARSYGRSPKGERILRPRDRHAKRFTVYLALGYEGLVHKPYISSQNATDDNFVKYVRNVLAPKIRPGSVVVWDNSTIIHARMTYFDGASVKCCSYPQRGNFSIRSN